MSLYLAGSTSDPPTNRLHLFTERIDTADVHITVVGDVDMSTAHQFTDYVVGQTDNCGRLILDMNQVTFFDCAGLSALHDIEERCHASNVSLEVKPAHCVSRVMMLCESLCA